MANNGGSVPAGGKFVCSRSRGSDSSGVRSGYLPGESEFGGGASGHACRPHRAAPYTYGEDLPGGPNPPRPEGMSMRDYFRTCVPAVGGYGPRTTGFGAEGSVHVASEVKDSSPPEEHGDGGANLRRRPEGMPLREFFRTWVPTTRGYCRRYGQKRTEDAIADLVEDSDSDGDQ